MSDKDSISAEVFILFKLEGLKTALSDSPFSFAKIENHWCLQLFFRDIGKSVW